MMLFKGITTIIIATAALQLCLLDGAAALPAGSFPPITAVGAPVVGMTNEHVQSVGQTDTRSLGTVVRVPGTPDTFVDKTGNLVKNTGQFIRNNAVEFASTASGVAAGAVTTAALAVPLTPVGAGAVGTGVKYLDSNPNAQPNNGGVAPIIPGQQPKTLVPGPINPPQMSIIVPK
ncbi:hypothetical protein BDF22DRAFT_684602 [Syncephalis plumigaleata]|nr:hypothetical protein BDF22DRAFT_684602 [Syncephalis plumigaleata]